MKSLYLLFIILFSSFYSYSQDIIDLRGNADNIYRSGNYTEAAKQYQDISKLDGGRADDFYNAACSWALAGDTDKALEWLDAAFQNGFTNLENALNDRDLINIQNTKTFKDLIEKEKSLQNEGVVTMKEIIRDLSKRKVVSYVNKQIINDYGEPFNTIRLNDYKLKQMISDNEQHGLKLTKDSLIDFSKKKLYLVNCFGDIHFQNIKLNYFSIQSDNTQIERNKDSPYWQNIIQLNRMEVGIIDFNINGYGLFRTMEFTADRTDNYNVTNTKRVGIMKSSLEMIRDYGGVGLFNPGSVVGSREKPIEVINIWNSTLRTRSTEEYPSMWCLNMYTNRLNFRNNIIEDEATFGSSEINELKMYRNRFLKPVDLSGVTFLNPDIYMPYEQFEAGFGFEDNARSWEITRKKLLITGELNEVVDDYACDGLVFFYKKMHDNYRTRGDLKSANASYLKMKDIIINKDYLDYQENKTFKSWLTHKIGVLLKIYTENGTSPAKAIVMSFYLIFLFSILYMFFPSEWDLVSKTKLIKQFKTLIEKNTHGYFKPFLTLSIGLLLSWLNAFALSLNAFVTLGFGSIPTKGIGRYICIIQGFIGWFLLSIFTVSLINQVLP